MNPYILITFFLAGFGFAWVAQDWRYGERIAENENKLWQSSLEATQHKIEIDRLNTQRANQVIEIAALREQKQEIQTRTITNEVIKYIQSPDVKCTLSAEWVRIHNAAVGQLDLP
jgi:hypothetical protein